MRHLAQGFTKNHGAAGWMFASHRHAGLAGPAGHADQGLGKRPPCPGGWTAGLDRAGNGPSWKKALATGWLRKPWADVCDPACAMARSTQRPKSTNHRLVKAALAHQGQVLGWWFAPNVAVCACAVGQSYRCASAPLREAPSENLGEFSLLHLWPCAKMRLGIRNESCMLLLIWAIRRLRSYPNPYLPKSIFAYMQKVRVP